MIAHPPCTYLSNAGAARLYKRIDGESYVKLSRLMEGLAAKDFFMALMNANIPKIAIENPIPSGVYRLPKYTQVIQPYEYGHPFSKKNVFMAKGFTKTKTNGRCYRKYCVLGIRREQRRPRVPQKKQRNND